MSAEVKKVPTPPLSPRDVFLPDPVKLHELFEEIQKVIVKNSPSDIPEIKNYIEKLNIIRVDHKSSEEDKKQANDLLDKLEFILSSFANESSVEDIRLIRAKQANRKAGDKIDIYGLLEEGDVAIDKKIILGSGTFGTVYAGHITSTGLPVAIKELNPDRSEGDLIAFQNEAEIMARMHHPYCCEYVGYLNDPFRVVTRRYPANLFDMTKSNTLTVADRFRIAYQLASAISYVHSIGLLHRDLKSENVFIDENSDVKLADFGLTEYAPGRVKDDGSPPGSKLFMAPEMLKGEAFDPKCEVYTYGLMMYELFTGREVFDDVKSIEQLLERQKCKPMLPIYEKDYSGKDKPPKELFDLIQSCYLESPKDRPELIRVMKSITDIAVHYFIKRSQTAERFWKSLCNFTFRDHVLLSEFVNGMISYGIVPRYPEKETLTKAVPSSWNMMGIDQFWLLCCWFPNFYCQRNSYALMENIVNSPWFCKDDAIVKRRFHASSGNCFVIRPSGSNPHSGSDPFHRPFTLCLRINGEAFYYRIERHSTRTSTTFTCVFTDDKHFTSISVLAKFVESEKQIPVANSLEKAIPY